MKRNLLLLMALCAMSLTIGCGDDACDNPNPDYDSTDPSSVACLDSGAMDRGADPDVENRSEETVPTPVGSFTSSLSSETETVQNMTPTQMNTLCEEFSTYKAAKMDWTKAQLGSCYIPFGNPDAGVTENAGCESADYATCDATVAELQDCITASVEAAQRDFYDQYAKSCSDTAGDTAGMTAGAPFSPWSGYCNEVRTRCPYFFFSVTSQTENSSDSGGVQGEEHSDEEHENEGEDEGEEGEESQRP